MPPKRIDDPATTFANWLTWESDAALGLTTARVYGSIVRSVVRDLGEIGDTEETRWRHIVEPAKVRDFFQSLWKNDPARFERTKRPWGLFCEWGESQGLPVVSVPSMKKGDDLVTGLPLAAVQAIHYLVSRRIFPLRVLPYLVWDDVGLLKDEIRHVRDPRQHGTFVLVPESVIEGLRTFAIPEDGLTPLIPAGPGLRTPYPGRLLGNELKKYRRAHSIEKIDDLKEQIEAVRAADRDGSALGSPPPTTQPERSTKPSPRTGLDELDLAALMAFDPDEEN